MKRSYFSLIVLVTLSLGGCTILPKNVPESPVITITPTKQITSSPTPSVDETEIIRVAIKKALVAKHGNSANELTITVSKVIGNYSQGGASSSGGGGMWFAAKENNEWQLVWDGNGNILCQDLTAYPDFPTSMIPECYDQITNKTVVR